jgi:hypothetical protein
VRATVDISRRYEGRDYKNGGLEVTVLGDGEKAEAA